ncbi:DAK2 domain-containing protein ['Camptotheca acuminata' phytoplasma]|uniref:DAK2 domain-containing protein n=1 Tax='Camptotheca acuminata' phytoplasma TaxID=3239192 RepID=UPI00351A7ED8
MSKNKLIDGILFKKMIINGTFNLKNNYQKINNMNVFPVPDGDTGTNMQMTMMEGVKKIQSIDNNSIVEIAKILSDSLLIGSKGNSGVILSQFFSGIYEFINHLNKNNISIEEFLDAMVSGYQKAYKAVMKPVEGTVLTVLRESIENTKKNSNKMETIEEMLQLIIENAKISLDNTPSLLPILKESNVVDSGGQGFILILEGMLLYLNKIELKDTSEEIQIFDLDNQNHISSIKELKYYYCTEFIIQLNNPDAFDIEINKEKMLKYGDSLILLKDNDLLKIHIHTNNYDDVLNELLVYGKLIKSKIDNMKEQNENFILNKKKKGKTRNKYYVITFGSGQEIKNIFKDLKANFVIDFKNKSFSEKYFNTILEKANAENIIILPNDSEIIPILKNFSQQKSELNITILNTTSIAEIYSSLLVFDTSFSLEENLKNINNNIQKIKIGQIINSKYSTEHKENNLPNGFFLSMFKKQIIENDKDLFLLTQNLLKKMIKNVNNFLTIFYNKKKFFKDNLEKIEFFLETEYPDLEVEKIQNDNQVYPYIFVLE